MELSEEKVEGSEGQQSNSPRNIRAGFNFIDADIFVYRVGYGLKDYELLENLDGLDTAVNEVITALPDYKPILVISNPLPTFRHVVAKTLPYKGHRKTEKPTFYKELRQYLLEEKGAIMSGDGFEADDYIGMNVNKKTDIISTIDKDLYMIPSRGHYNFVKKEFVKIKKPAYYFWKQMLIGDKADNIQGLHLIGEKRSTEMLDGLKTKELRGVVEQAYKYEFGENWFTRFDENGRLLWIKRHADKEYFDYV
jgi:5'-3' exonuclease